MARHSQGKCSRLSNMPHHSLSLPRISMGINISSLLFLFHLAAALNTLSPLLYTLSASPPLPSADLPRPVRQLILKSKVSQPLSVQYLVLRGPFGDARVAPAIYSHEFSDSQPESEFQRLPLPDAAECNRMLAARSVNIR